VVRPQRLLLTHAATAVRDLRIQRDRLELAGHRPSGCPAHRPGTAPEGLPPDTSADLKPEEVILSKTADRSVLGAGMAFPCEHTVISSAGLDRTDLAELGRLLRRNINTDRGYAPPIELAAAPPGRRQ
jgi:hypothetical protein